MCGIFGYISASQLRDDAVLTALSKRGPDGKGKVSFPFQGELRKKHCTLLHTRLSIIDLSPLASQPMFDSEERWCIVFNGEIYNYKDIRKELERLGHQFRSQSDTEVILNGYIQWRGGILERLRGMFAFCIYDTLEQKLFIARDHFGMKPLYYYKSDLGFCFSSTVNAIFASGIQSRYAISSTALRQYFAFGSFLPPLTIVEEIRSLPPGHFMTYRADSLHIERYFDPQSSVSSRECTWEVAKDQVRTVMMESVEKHLVADVPVGIFLSGGIDSSLIAGIASRVSKEKIRTFTVGFKDRAGVQDESVVAEHTAHWLGSNHETVRLSLGDFATSFDEFVGALDVPSVDGLNTFLISRAVASQVKVTLSGLGGDEMFAGYPVFHEVSALQHITPADSALARLPVPLLNRMDKGYLRYVGTSLFDLLVQKRASGTLGHREREYMRQYYAERIEPLKAASLFEISNYMANTLLRDTDAVTLHHSLECRAPFVDKEVLRVVMSIPDRYKVQKEVNKPLLVSSFSDLLLPETYRRPKTGFTLPIAHWMRGYLSKERRRTLHHRAIDYNVFSKECPFREASGRRRKATAEREYMWLVLLQWLEQHELVLGTPES